MTRINWGSILACGALALVCWAMWLALRDRQPDTFSIDPPAYAVEEPVTTVTVPDNPLGGVVSPPPAPVAVVTRPADRGVMIQITETVPPPPTLPRHQHHDIWIRLAECESGGDWSINTGNGYYGGVQFAITSWRTVGGVGWPHQASVWEQMYRAELLLDIQGWGAWPSCSRQLGLR